MYRVGGPKYLVTEQVQMAFDATGRFRLESIHPGFDLDSVLQQTGFEFDHSPQPAETRAPETGYLELLRGVLGGSSAAVA